MATTASGIALINTLNIQQRRAFLQYAGDCAERNSSALNGFRTQLTWRDRVYQRQLDVTDEQMKAVRGNMAGDARKIQNMAVPIVMPQIESATAYQTGVYLTSHPIFGVVSYPKNMTQALAFETVISQQSQRYGWARELIKVIRNGYKYNFGAAVCLWEKTPLKQIVTNTSPGMAAGTAQLQDYSYGANRIRAIDPYNMFCDMTVAPSNMHTDGEYFGWNEIMSRVMLKRLLRMLDPMKTSNAKEALESKFAGLENSGCSGKTYFTPQINRMMDLGTVGRSDRNWGQWAGLVGAGGSSRIQYSDNYMVTHFLCRALPSDFGKMGAGSNTDRVFYGIIINWKVVVFVEELAVAHDFLPAYVMQPYEDGLGYQTQSMIDNAAPFQDMGSALWNATLESKRRAVFDRLVYNPRMIDKKDIDPNSSVARIPLRNVAMSKDGNEIARAVYQIPYRDENSAANLQMADMISGMADTATGQNKVDRGEFQKGNKTRTEFTQTMSNSNSRQQLSSLVIQGQFMTPLKETIKSNTLQFQTATTILSTDKKQEVPVDPIELRKAILEFQMTDGMLPTDKIMNPELLMVFMQTAQSIPSIQTEYDVMGMFLYWAKLQGATWVEEFKRDANAQQQFLKTMQATTMAQNPPPQASAAA